MAINFPRPQIKKNTALFLGALVLSGIAVVLVLKYLEGQKLQYQSDLNAAISRGMVQVVVPVRDVAAGTIVDGSNMSQRLYPQDLVYEGAVTAAKWREYQGRLLVRGVKTGRPLLDSDFVATAALDFAGSLPANTRAVTIAVDTINSVNGLIRPGNWVDVMLSTRGLQDSNSADGTKVLPLLRRTKVLATGRALSNDDPKLASDGQAATSSRDLREYSTLTVAVRPEEASALVLAQQVGQLRVVLASTKFDADNDVPRLTQRQLLAQLSGLTLAADKPLVAATTPRRVSSTKPAAVEPKAVQFIIGSGRGVQRSSEPAQARAAPRARPTAAVPVASEAVNAAAIAAALNLAAQ